jgi:hypothetical protein
MARRGAHSFKTASRTKQATPLHDLDSKATQTNVPLLMCLEESTRRRQGLDGLREDVEQDVSPCRTLRPGGTSPGQQPTPAAHHCSRTPIVKSAPPPMAKTTSSKKITTLWCHRRLVRSPDLEFPPASDGRGVTVKAMSTPSRRKLHPQASPCSALAFA